MSDDIRVLFRELAGRPSSEREAHYRRQGISTVVCGPGHIAQAHQADEYVSLDQLARCEAFLQRLMQR